MSVTNNVASNILDTVRSGAKGIELKPYHALRTYEAFQFLNKMADLKNINLKYDEIENQLTRGAGMENKIVRIIFLQHDFSYQYQQLPLDKLPPIVPLNLVTEIRQNSGLGHQNYKWEDRPYWEKLSTFKSQSAFDTISVNEKDEVVETSRFNLFFFDAVRDVVLTPALSCGCINGVYRRFVFQQGYINLPALGRKNIVESSVHFNDINSYQVFAANSVRGVLAAAVVA